MRRSMTAYGRAHLSSSTGRWTVEISSLNRKGLDINTTLPPAMLFLDPHLRKWVAEVAERGQVSVRVSFDISDPEQSIHLLQQQKKKWVKVAAALGFPPSAVGFQFLVEKSDLQQDTHEEKTLLQDLRQAWQVASKQWILMREKEGALLVKDIEKRLQLILKDVKTVEKKQPELQDKTRKKLQEKMKALKLSIEEDKIVREAALIVEKADITEEVTRLYSHEEQMKAYLRSKDKSVGRTLDFLAQEMGREISTMMAKAGDTFIAKIAVAVKSEIEKIREQVQNIE